MIKYFLEELKNVTLQTGVGMSVIMGVGAVIALLFVCPILLIPTMVLGALCGIWLNAMEKYECQREADKKCVSDLYCEIHHIAVIYKDVHIVGFRAFKEAFNEYCKNYPKDKETIEVFANHYQDLKRMFKSLGVEVE